MRSFVVFSILGQSYGIDIDRVKRILPAQLLTKVADEEEHVEGILQYENSIIKVLSFRRIIGSKSYVEQLQELFPDLKTQHKAWIDELIKSVEEGTPFTKTVDPHACNLGKWIDSFHPDDEDVTQVMKKLNFHHQQLHKSAVDVLEKRESSAEEAHKWIEDNVQEIYKNTISYLEKISQKAEQVAAGLQRCLILSNDDDKLFGVNIDSVEDIVHIEEKLLHNVNGTQEIGKFMSVEAILEKDGKLITIVKDIKGGV